MQFEIKIGLNASGGANGGHAQGEVEARKAVRHLAIDPIAHGIKHVVMHADESGDDAIALEVENFGAFVR